MWCGTVLLLRSRDRLLLPSAPLTILPSCWLPESSPYTSGRARTDTRSHLNPACSPLRSQ